MYLKMLAKKFATNSLHFFNPAMAEWNIAAALSNAAKKQPDQVALISGRNGDYRKWTFRELLDQSNAYAAAISSQGIERGDRVMLMVRPSMDFISLTFALFHIGAVVILIDPGMGYANLLRCIGSVKPLALIAIPPVQLFSRIFRKPFKTVKIRICVGRSLGLLGKTLKSITSNQQPAISSPVTVTPDEQAAIIFTTGSTGPPKGVQYTHGIFSSQLDLIRDYFGIGAKDVDQPGFPLFALFSTALGATAVIPDMDPTKPAHVDPKKFIRSIIDHQVTYSFGSPAIWNVVSRYCKKHNITLPVKKILMAGAPVPGSLIKRVQDIIPQDGTIFTPYGATESLPVTAITGQEISEHTWKLTRQGMGTCVGRPLPKMTVRIIKPIDIPFTHWKETEAMPTGEIGEIVVKGPVVTAGYDHNEPETSISKIPDTTGFWHRMGDMGYCDDQDRLWFCGRKAHRVLTASGPMYTICCEAIFNTHLLVFRSALVGIGSPDKQAPVLIVELYEPEKNTKVLFAELRELAKTNKKTLAITTFLIHPEFPVDIRHNAKIFREKLAVWAAQKMKG